MRSNTGDGGAPVAQAEFKKAEENLNRVVQRETPRVIFKCRINNEVLYTRVRMYNKKGKKNAYI